VLSVLEALDYESLDAGPEHSFTFSVEALDAGGTMPPAMATVTVNIVVGLVLGMMVVVVVMGPSDGL